MDEYLTGYKIMKTENGKIVSGADSRQSFPLEKNKSIDMYGNGIYLGMDKDYVFNYYSGLADEEVLLTLRFKKSDIIVGDLNDREPELSVKKATIIDFQHIIEGEFVQPSPKKRKLKI